MVNNIFFKKNLISYVIENKVCKFTVIHLSNQRQCIIGLSV